MTASTYSRAVMQSALAILHQVSAAQHYHAGVMADELTVREFGLQLLLHACWDLQVRPATLLERAHATASTWSVPTWADPHVLLAGVDLGRLCVASGPGDMAALAGSTASLLRMIREAQRRDRSEFARACRIPPAVLARVESGEQDPELRVVLGLCWQLRLLPSTLLGMAESRTFASGTRRPLWRDPGRVLARADTHLGCVTTRRRLGTHESHPADR